MDHRGIYEVKRSDGTRYSPRKYRVRVTVGNDPETNRPVRRSRIVDGTLHEAIQTRDAWEEEIRRCQQPMMAADAEVTFKEYAEEWHEERIETGAISRNRDQVESYLLGNIYAQIGAVRVRDVTTRMVKSCLTRIRKSKVEGGGRCNGTTLNMHYGLLRQILEEATDDGLLSRNPAAKVKAPKCSTPDVRVLSKPESVRLARVLDECEEAAYERRRGIEERRIARGDTSQPLYLRGLSEVSRVLAIRLALFTGMRRGEILALTWGEVDLERKSLRVIASLTPEGEVKEPKTKAGKRRIKLDAATVDHLKRWKERQREEFRLLSLLQTDLTPVCCSDLGGYLYARNLNRWWSDFVKENSFDSMTIHGLRHTHATQLIANGIDIKTVQHRLGHSSAAITMNLYAHFVPENDDAAAQLIGDLLCGTDGEQIPDGPVSGEELRCVS